MSLVGQADSKLFCITKISFMKQVTFVLMNGLGKESRMFEKLNQTAAATQVSLTISETPNDNGYYILFATGDFMGLLAFTNHAGFEGIRLVCKRVD